ncbi:MAG: glycosyltransferase [Lachnospiraceae bacterium]|nr:glycosyltransferase [Lachnospiraceae bacterium]
MNLLIDFLTTHGLYGAGEYHRRIVHELIKTIKQDRLTNIQLYAIHDSRLTISYNDLTEQAITKEINIKFIDLRNTSILDVIQQYQINKFFIACGQRVGEYPDISKVRCETICVTHDLLYEEWYNNHIYEHWILNASRWQKLNWICRTVVHPTRLFLAYLRSKAFQKNLSFMKAVFEMLNNNSLAKCITVSEYTKRTIVYNFSVNPEKIEVLYSPEKLIPPKQNIQNQKLRELIEKKIKYFIILSADRESKNANKAIKAFKAYSQFDKYSYLLVSGSHAADKNNIINVEYLSDSDFIWAMENCHALIYPTYFEGFGYPPIEAMKYGKPILTSNTTSLPEILGEAPIYFSPLYESAIFDALMKLKEADYEKLSKKSLIQYQIIINRQKKDLAKLISLILH